MENPGEVYLVNIGDKNQIIFSGLEETIIEDGKVFSSKLKSHDEKCIKGAQVNRHW